eukprot:g2868.t1
MSYYNIDSILAEGQRIPVVFNVAADKLGHLCPGMENAEDADMLSSGSKVELPLWLAGFCGEKQYVEAKMPSFYSARVRSRLRADPNVVNLRDRSPYFYQLGQKMSNMLGDDDLTPVLQKALALRYSKIMDCAFNSSGEDTTYFTRKLTELELSIFRKAAESAKNISQWKHRHHIKLRSSEVVRKSYKRRRLTK